MIILKFKESNLYQRFFLDAAIGFWEEWREEDAFNDLNDLEQEDIATKFNLLDKKISSIICEGSFVEFSSIDFKFGDINLLLKFSDNNDIESNIVLEKL